MSLPTISGSRAPLARFADLLDPPPNPYLHDVAGWVDARTNEFFWSKQVEIARSVVENRRTAVKSCHGVGKSFSAARFICWWLDVHPPGEAFVVSTAPTAKQVEAVLWREVNKAAAKADPPFMGRVLTTEWKLGNELVAYGRKPADHDPTAFQGIHARYVLVVLDEACGIPKELWIAANALATNTHSRILAIGNPDDPGSHFAEVCKPGSGWHVIRISAFDSPAFTGERVPADLLDLLVSQTYVDEMALDVGEDSPVYLSKVLGEFPEDSESGVVRISKLKACQHPDEHEDLPKLDRIAKLVGSGVGPIELGVDVGAGGDLSVIYGRFGPVAMPLWRKKTPDTMELVGQVIEHLVLTRATSVKIDRTGVGQGVTDRVREQVGAGVICDRLGIPPDDHDVRVFGVMVGAASDRPTRFVRLRDQIWWEVGRQLCEAEAWDLSLLDDRTVAQLVAPTYRLDSSGRIKVERKEDLKERIGKSPDDADALLLAFYRGKRLGLAYDTDDEIPPATAPDGSPLLPLLTGTTFAGDTSTGFTREDQADNGKVVRSPYV